MDSSENIHFKWCYWGQRSFNTGLFNPGHIRLSRTLNLQVLEGLRRFLFHPNVPQFPCEHLCCVCGSALCTTRIKQLACCVPSDSSFLSQSYRRWLVQLAFIWESLLRPWYQRIDFLWRLFIKVSNSYIIKREKLVTCITHIGLAAKGQKQSLKLMAGGVGWGAQGGGPEPLRLHCTWYFKITTKLNFAQSIPSCLVVLTSFKRWVFSFLNGKNETASQKLLTFFPSMKASHLEMFSFQQQRQQRRDSSAFSTRFIMVHRPPQST